MILVSIVLTAIYCSSVWPVIFWNSSLIWTMSISHRDTTTLTSVSSSVPIPFIVFWSWYAKWAALFLTHRTRNINENWLDRQSKKISESFSLVEETCTFVVYYFGLWNQIIITYDMNNWFFQILYNTLNCWTPYIKWSAFMKI